MSKHLKFKLTALTDVGEEREHNEDNYICNPKLEEKKWIFTNESKIELSNHGCLMVIADGMGGTNAGEVASEIAVKSVKEYFNSKPIKKDINENEIKKTLNKVILKVHNNIKKHSKSNPSTRGMGTTIVIAWINKSIVHISWVGDSRAYLYNKSKGLICLTKDHSYVQELVDKKEISYEQAFYHPESNIITQSLGDKTPSPDYVNAGLVKGDKILLCSDGLNGMLQDKQISEILSKYSDIVECSKKLVSDANKEGGLDNTTVILCDILLSSGFSSNIMRKTKVIRRKLFWLSTIALIILILLFLSVLKFDRLSSFLNKEKNNFTGDTIVNQKEEKSKVSIGNSKIKNNIKSKEIPKTKDADTVSKSTTTNKKTQSELTPIMKDSSNINIQDTLKKKL
ncbi:MAG: Stp1/IreP family PP2C-type Ser/Thr phosphatase [Bacteroidota bacterium]|nr:Stp1/IreP family PP2C-type Ser/Thr phosphatase [Bacteroidota bacterium]